MIKAVRVRKQHKADIPLKIYDKMLRRANDVFDSLAKSPFASKITAKLLIENPSCYKCLF